MLHRGGNQKPNPRTLGFTLIEMAIVLGIAGVLFAGLWRLLSSSNVQLRDQATANQQLQVINGVNNYLQSTAGQTYITAQAGTTFTVALPTAAAPAGTPGCTAALPTDPDICSALPPGFSVATTNPYGQTYQVNVLKGATGTYSFMIVTINGDTISDTSGGRISGLIGGDGGFLYSSNVCNAAFATNACGSYGSWQSPVSNYGLAGVTGSGHMATRTFYTPSQNSNSPWLARQLMTGDNPLTPFFNTMTTSLFLGGQSFFLGSNSSFTTGGNPTAAINAQGGVINMQAGVINMMDNGATTTTGGTTFNLQGGTIQDNSAAVPGGRTNQFQPAMLISSSAPLDNGGAPGAVALVQLGTKCTKDSTATGGTGLTYDATGNCADGIDVVGDEGVTGQLSANTLYAQTFIYQSSDMRLKTNIEPMHNALDDLMKINAVTFKFKATGRDSLGVIAQNVEEVYPQIVSTKPDGMKAVSYEGLIGPLIGAVQELKKQNDVLRAQLHEQGLREKELERKIDMKP